MSPFSFIPESTVTEQAQLGRGGFQDFPIFETARTCCKATHQVRSGDDFIAQVLASFEQAQEGTPGPILVEVPRDVWLQPVREPLLGGSLPVRHRFTPRMLCAQALEPHPLTQALERVQGSFDGLIVGNGLHRYVALQAFSAMPVVSSDRFGCMGFALPAAIGASLACPEAKLLLVIGDGDLNMSLHELGSLQQYRIPLTVVVVNNGGVGSINQLRSKLGEGAEGFLNPDFASLASAFGLSSLRLEVSDLGRALLSPRARHQPLLLDCQTVLERYASIEAMRELLYATRNERLPEVSVSRLSGGSAVRLPSLVPGFLPATLGRSVHEQPQQVGGLS